MPRFTFSTHIAAPPERVFEKSTDFEHAPEFLSGVERTEVVTDGPVAKGTTWRETRVMFGKEHTETLEVADFNPPKSLRIGCDSCGVIWDSEFRFTPEKGGTRVDLVMEGKAQTFWARVMGAVMMPMMARSIKKAIEQDLADIKCVCEGGRQDESARPAPSPA